MKGDWPEAGPEPRPDENAKDEALEELLRGASEPRAREAFRAELRRRFAGGEFVSSASRPTGDARTNQHVTSPFEDYLHAAGVPLARKGFRDDLRARFLNGFDERIASPAPRRAGPGAVEATPVFGHAAYRRFAGFLAVAAAVLFVVLLTRPDPLSWAVLRAPGSGFVTIDGRRVPSDDTATLAALLPEAVELETGTEGIELGLGDELVLEVRPATRVRPYDIRDASPDGSRQVELLEGEIYVHRRSGAAGPRLVVATPDSRVVVTGTVLGIYVRDDVTCVCVAEGEVQVHPRSRSSAEGPVAVTAEQSFLRSPTHLHGKLDPFAPYVEQGQAGRKPHDHDLVDFARVEGVR